MIEIRVQEHQQSKLLKWDGLKFFELKVKETLLCLFVFSFSPNGCLQEDNVPELQLWPLNKTFNVSALMIQNKTLTCSPFTESQYCINGNRITLFLGVFQGFLNLWQFSGRQECSMREVSFIIFIYMSLLRYSPYIVCLFSAYIRFTFLDTCFSEVIPWQKYAYFSVVHNFRFTGPRTL